MNDHDLRSYLLGEVNDSAAERLEVGVLDDHDVFEALCSAEDDLFDDYAQGTLSRLDEQRFLARYGAEHGRLLVALALAKRAAGSRRLLFGKFGRRHWALAAAAATLVASLGVSLWARKQPARKVTAVRDPVSNLLPAAVVLLSLGTSRSAAPVPEIAIEPETAVLELRIRLNPADRFDEYSVELRSPSGARIWQAEHLHASEDRGDLVLVSRAPANVLSGGSYEVSVRGATGTNARDVLGFATVSIRR